MTVEITLRQVKGAPLTFNEVDDNFSNLKDAADAASGDVSAIDARLTTAEGEIDTLQSNATTLAGRVTAIEADYTTTATTINLGAAATALNMGATTGTATIRNPTLVGTQTTQNLYNTVATTLNIGGAATTLSIGAATGTMTVNNATLSVKALTATGTAALNGGTTTTTLTTSGNATLGSGSGNIHVVNGALINERLGSQGALSGFRNRIINGACDIAQRPSVAVPNNIATYGGPDRFIAANSTGGGQFTQSQGSLTFQGVARNSVRQTVNTANTNIAGTNYWFGIDHRIEGFNAYDLLGKQVAVSLLFNTNVSGTYSVALRDGASGLSYITTITAVANTPQLVKIPVAAIPAAASVPRSNAIGLELNVGALNTGTFQTGTLNAWQTGNFISATGATNWGATAGNFIELTELQLEEGSVATPFERRSYGVELALCERYFEVCGRHHHGGVWGSAFGTSGGVRLDCAGTFRTKKRAAPTCTSNGTISYTLFGSAPLTGSSQSFFDVSVNGVSSEITITSDISGRTGCYLTDNIWASAEL